MTLSRSTDGAVPCFPERDWEARVAGARTVLEAGVLLVAAVSLAAPGPGVTTAHQTATAEARSGSTLHLTYDDGGSRLTPKLLDILDRYPEVRVTFFVNCREAVPGTFQRILDSGHALANHTCSHARLPRLRGSQVLDELSRLEDYVDARVREDVRFESYRPPYGETSRAVRSVTGGAGYHREWMWDVDSDDWKGVSARSIVARLESMRDGDIALMHDSDGRLRTLEATDRYLQRHASRHRFAVLPHTFTTPQEPEVWDGRFHDDDGSTFEADIEWIADRGITRGCNPPANTEFCPGAVVSRGEMATFLVRALGLAASRNDTFDDDTGSVHEAAIDAFAAAGITRGCDPPSNDRFCPDGSVTRGEMATFLARALRLPAAQSDVFGDDDGSLHEDAVDRLAAAGITRGCNPPTNSRFCPDHPVTRGEMAALLRRALEADGA